MKKPTIAYELEAKGDRAQKELITARITAGWYCYLNGKKKYERAKVSLQSTILPSNWGKGETGYKYDAGIFEKFSKGNGGVKSAMYRLEAVTDRLYSNYLKNNTYPTCDQFKKELLIQLGRDERAVKTDTTIASYLLKRIEYFEGIVGTGRKDELSKGRIKTYKTLLHYIQRYNLETENDITFATLDEELYNKFWIFQDEVMRGNILINIEGKRKQKTQPHGFTRNGIQKYQKALLKVCKWAMIDKVDVALNVTDTNLIVKDTEAQKDIYIDEVNLNKIINHQPVNGNTKIAHDFVILSALTGMRYESMADANKELIQHHKDKTHDFYYIHSEQGKTQTEAIIPLLPMALQIIENNGGAFPVFPSNQLLNDYIKQLFKEARITATSTLTVYPFRGDMFKEKTTVNAIISCHDMRKSFYTNLANAGLSQAVIEQVTHPQKQITKMSGYYDKRGLLNKAIQFYDEVKRNPNVKEPYIYK